MFLVVPEALVQFRRLYPDARVRIVEGMTSALLPMVRDETLDFALAVRPEKPESGLRFRPLIHDSLAIAVRKGHPLRNEQSLRNLKDAEWLSLDWVNPALNQVFSAAGIATPRSITRCETFNSAFALLATSDLVAAMPRRLLIGPFSRGVLQPVPVADRMPTFTLCITTRADAPLSRTASAMAKVVTSVARQIARRK
jgi:DNA-binding transcriptional LysR family regulator